MLKVGIDVLTQRQFAPLENKRVGLFTNPSAVNTEMVSTYQLLVEADSVNLMALFAAEHGVFGRVADGEVITSTLDAATGIPIHSIYGKQYRPSAEMLADIDVLVCDIQDIGVRYYTYQWTMTHIIEACGEHGVPVMVLDRPNPLGDVVAGRGLDAGFESLVGRFDIPMQHGLTVGEMMQVFNGEWNPTPADLSIVACENHQRNKIWVHPFVPPSPNMPHLSTVRHYPGACLIEGTNISEGRGTTLPFEIAGAPYINADDLAHELNHVNLPDVRFRPHHFMPTIRKFANEACEGVQVHITGERFDAITTWVTVIHVVRNMYPEHFDWVPPFVEGDHPMFDKLMGGDKPRLLINQGASVAEIMAGWAENAEAFRTLRQPYLIYS